MSAFPPQVTIAARFAGPPSSGNGGYTAGLLAEHVTTSTGAPVRVTLRRPPPLEAPLRVLADSDSVGTTLLLDGETVIAGATAGRFSAVPVTPVEAATAARAQASYRGLSGHPFPSCFVCGTARDPGDALRLQPGPIGDARTACLWTPHPGLVPDGEAVAPRFTWAALDCPGWTSDLDTRPLVLGQMTAACEEPPIVGRPYVVVAQLLREEGRKTFTASTLYDARRVIARAEHIWIAIDPGRFT